MNRRTLGPIPVSGAWTPQDPIAFRKFAQLGPLRLENGSFLPEVTLAYETLGTLNEDRSNAILVLRIFPAPQLLASQPPVGGKKPLDRVSHWIPSAISLSSPTSLVAARGVPVRPRPRLTGSRGDRDSPLFPPGIKFLPRPDWPITSAFRRGMRSWVPPWEGTAL